MGEGRVQSLSSLCSTPRETKPNVIKKRTELGLRGEKRDVLRFVISLQTTGAQGWGAQFENVS